MAELDQNNLQNCGLKETNPIWVFQLIFEANKTMKSFDALADY